MLDELALAKTEGIEAVLGIVDLTHGVPRSPPGAKVRDGYVWGGFPATEELGGFFVDGSTRNRRRRRSP